MVLEAKKYAADAVKFQTFSADTLVSPNTPKVEYQKNTTSPEEKDSGPAMPPCGGMGGMGM
jgi:N-acetylneuraminate synthase/N,N'-diacetyllegionaminate synthase